jgi:protein-serine/threonine kinase
VKNPKAVLDVLAFYTENIGSKEAKENVEQVNVNEAVYGRQSEMDMKSMQRALAPFSENKGRANPDQAKFQSEYKQSPQTPKKRPPKEIKVEMTDSQVAEKLLGIVSKGNPHILYTKIKKIGQG